MTRPPTRTLVFATILLVSGAFMVASPSRFWQFAGGVHLIFVPVLIAQYAVAVARPRRVSRLDALLMLDELDRADRRTTQQSQPAPGETVSSSDPVTPDR